LPDVIVKRVDARQNLDWGESFRASITVENQGVGATAAWMKLGVYASLDPRFDLGDVLLGTVDIPAALGPGQSATIEADLKAPATPISGIRQAPSYYLTVAVDPQSRVAELVETNNASLGQGIDTLVVTITPRLPSRVVAVGFSVQPESVKWGDSLNFTARIRNEGPGIAPPTNARIVLIPAGQSSLEYTIGYVPLPSVGAFQTITANQSVRLPESAPRALASQSRFALVMVPDSDAIASQVIPGSPSHQVGVDTAFITIEPPAASNPTPTTPAPTVPTTPAPVTNPDLHVSSVSSPSTAVTWGQTFQVGATVENRGNANITESFKVRFTMIQSDDPGAPRLVLGDVTIPGLAAGMAQDVLKTVSLPFRIPEGMIAEAPNGRLVVQVDAESQVLEASEANNQLASRAFGLRLVNSDGQVTTPTPTLVATNAQTSTPTPEAPRSGSGKSQTLTPAQRAQRQAQVLRRQAQQAQRRARLLAARQRRQEQPLRVFPGQNPSLAKAPASKLPKRGGRSSA
jgi:hypothetical protein